MLFSVLVYEPELQHLLCEFLRPTVMILTVCVGTYVTDTALSLVTRVTNRFLGVNLTNSSRYFIHSLFFVSFFLSFCYV